MNGDSGNSNEHTSDGVNRHVEPACRRMPTEGHSKLVRLTCPFQGLDGYSRSELDLNFWLRSPTCRCSLRPSADSTIVSLRCRQADARLSPRPPRTQSTELPSISSESHSRSSSVSPRSLQISHFKPSVSIRISYLRRAAGSGPCATSPCQYPCRDPNRAYTRMRKPLENNCLRQEGLGVNGRLITGRQVVFAQLD